MDSRPRGETLDETACHDVGLCCELILLLAFAGTTERGATLLAAQAAPPDAVAADPARYSVLYENDVALMIRVKYPAGAKSVMHSHPAGCAIFYKDATLKMTSPTGEVRTHEYRAGDVSCGDAYSHLPENVGRDTEFIQFHLKNRKTFDHLQTGKKPRLSRSNQGAGSHRRGPCALLRPVRE